MHTLLLSALLATPSLHAALWTGGHGDLEMIYDGASWETVFLLGEPGEPAIVGGSSFEEVEAELSTVDIRVKGPRQTSAGILDSGAATVYLLPQGEGAAAALGNPFIGFATDENTLGTFVSDTITMSLISVSGPGIFSLWETDAFGTPDTIMSSAPGSSAPDEVGLAIDPGHVHFNLGFSETGVYDVTYRSEGDLVAGGTTGTDFTVRYNVIPEPTSSGLAALGAALLLISRRRR